MWRKGLLPFLLVVSLALAGCSGGGDGTTSTDTSTTSTSGSASGTSTSTSTGTTTPAAEPVVITGSAAAVNPAGFVQCVEGGVDGEYHALPRNVDGWSFTIDLDGYYAYWFDGSDGFLDGGTSDGTVPNGSANVEVCNEAGLPGTYTVTITPP